jgi:cell division transport system permease protein
MRLRMIGSEALRSITANLSTTIAATVTVLIGMFLVGLLIAFGTWARSWSDHTKDKLVVKVFFCTESTCDKPRTDKQIDSVRVMLESNPKVRSVDFVSKEQALERMRQQNPDLVKDLAYNPLPDAFEVQPVKGEYTKDIAQSIESASAGAAPRPPGVEKVTYGEKTANRILKVARVIEALFLLAVVILLAASALLIANTIRLSIFSRRREIEVMKLVGATNWFVRGPFMLEGLIVGFIGSVVAVFLLLLGKEIALPQILGHIDDGDDVKAIAFGLNALIVVGIGLLLGAAGSGLTIRRFLRV